MNFALNISSIEFSIKMSSAASSTFGSTGYRSRKVSEMYTCLWRARAAFSAISDPLSFTVSHDTKFCYDTEAFEN